MPLGKLECAIAILLLSFYAFPAWAEQQAPPDEPETPVAWADGQTKASLEIREALGKPLNNLGLSFQDTPLAEAVDFLRSEYNIEIQIDVPALDDLGLSTDDPVDCELRNISLAAALNLMLTQLDLTYVIADEVLLITSQEEALSLLTVGVYPVGDLLAPKAPDDSRAKPENINNLVNVIISCVASDTWVENGGPEAEIQVIQPGLLVISQTQDVHQQIASLLRALRQAKSHAFATQHASDRVPSRASEVDYLLRALRQTLRRGDSPQAEDSEEDTSSQTDQRGGGVF